MRITVYTSCKLVRMLWNEDDYSPDTGIAGKLRDRGRFFITDARAQLLGISPSHRWYKECNPDILWIPMEGACDEMACQTYQTSATKPGERNERNNKADVYCNRCEGHSLKDEEACIACTRLHTLNNWRKNRLQTI